MTKERGWSQAKVSSVWRPKEAIVWNCEGKAWIALETPKCWRWQSHGIPAEESDSQGVQLWEREVCFSQQSWTELGIWRALWCQTRRCRVWTSPRWLWVLLLYSISSLCSLSPHLEWSCISCAIVCFKYVIRFLILQEVGKRLLWTQKRLATLDF